MEKVMRVSITSADLSPPVGYVRLPSGERVPIVDGMTIPRGSVIETTTVDPACRVATGIMKKD
jgi:hypothetical protein